MKNIKVFRIYKGTEKQGYFLANEENLVKEYVSSNSELTYKLENLFETKHH